MLLEPSHQDGTTPWSITPGPIPALVVSRTALITQQIIKEVWPNKIYQMQHQILTPGGSPVATSEPSSISILKLPMVIMDTA